MGEKAMHTYSEWQVIRYTRAPRSERDLAVFLEDFHFVAE
jgi:hypothetical protein